MWTWWKWTQINLLQKNTNSTSNNWHNNNKCRQFHSWLIQIPDNLLISIHCLQNNSKLTSNSFMSNNNTNNNWWGNMIQTNWLIKTVNQSVQKCTSKLWLSNNSMEMKWEMNTVMKWWIKMHNISNSNNNSQKTIQFKTRSRRSFKFAQRMMRSLVTQNFQQTISHFTMIQWILLNMQWICRWLNGKDHRRSCLKMKSQGCTVMLWHLEISNKAYLEIAGS